MKQPIQKHTLALAAILLATAAPTLLAAPPHSQGHHQSGVIGNVSGGSIIATPTGEGSAILPDRVRVYSATFPNQLIADVGTEVQGNMWWHFEINLKPGHYLLVAYAPPAPENGGHLFSYPVPVTVVQHQFTEVVLSFAPQ